VTILIMRNIKLKLKHQIRKNTLSIKYTHMIVTMMMAKMMKKIQMMMKIQMIITVKIIVKNKYELLLKDK
jgi:hypothetical protein